MRQQKKELDVLNLLFLTIFYLIELVTIIKITEKGSNNHEHNAHTMYCPMYMFVQYVVCALCSWLMYM